MTVMQQLLHTSYSSTNHANNHAHVRLGLSCDGQNVIMSGLCQERKSFVEVVIGQAQALCICEAGPGRRPLASGSRVLFLRPTRRRHLQLPCEKCDLWLQCDRRDQQRIVRLAPDPLTTRSSLGGIPLRPIGGRPMSQRAWSAVRLLYFFLNVPHSDSIRLFRGYRKTIEGHTVKYLKPQWCYPGQQMMGTLE